MNDNIHDFVNIIFNKSIFDLEDTANVKHFLGIGEYEIAFESLILSCVHNKTSLAKDEIEEFKKYIKEYNLEGHSMYVENAENYFLDYYCPNP